MIRIVQEAQDAAADSGHPFTPGDAQSLVSLLRKLYRVDQGEQMPGIVRLGSTETMQNAAARIPAELRSLARSVIADGARVVGLQIQGSPPVAIIETSRNEMETHVIEIGRITGTVETIDETDL